MATASINSRNVISIGNRIVGDETPCLIIAEIGLNHNGNAELAKKIIDAAAEAGADAVKFQTFSTDEFLADKECTYTYYHPDGTKIIENQYEMFKRLELPYNCYLTLRDHAVSKGLLFISSTADQMAIDLLDELNAPAFKLASEDIINISLLEYLSKKKRPVIISTGMADLVEIEQAVNILRKNVLSDLVLLHCVSLYPTPPRSCNMRKILSLKAHFNVPVGFSDHTEGIDAAVTAIALGACVVEKHFTLDHSLPGPDHKFSADPDEFRTMVEKIRLIEMMLGSKELAFDPSEETGRIEFRRSIRARNHILSGEIITKDMLSYKRPGHGLKPYQQHLIVGKKAVREITPDELILLPDVSHE